jgi:hypothetical protein
MKDTALMPGLILIALSLASFVGGLAGFATQHADVGLAFACLAGAGFIVGFGWVLIEHRRVRSIEERWLAEHPDAPRRPPSG